MASIKIKGLKELIRKFDLLGDASALGNALKGAVKESAELVLTDLKENTPVDSGDLKRFSKITYTQGGLNAEIGPDEEKTPYGIWVEVGHHTRSGSFVPGQRYIERTSLESDAKIRKIFLETVRKFLK